MSPFRASFNVYDSSGDQIATVAKKGSALQMARVVGGTVRKGGKVIYSARNPVTKKKKQKAKKSATKRAPAKKNKSRKGKRPAAKKKKAASKSNPGKALKAKIAKMKPNTWYPTKLSGARVRVKRKGSTLIISAPAKKRSR